VDFDEVFIEEENTESRGSSFSLYKGEIMKGHAGKWKHVTSSLLAEANACDAATGGAPSLGTR
jgi:hypothetical protein